MCRTPLFLMQALLFPARHAASAAHPYTSHNTASPGLSLPALPFPFLILSSSLCGYVSFPSRLTVFSVSPNSSAYQSAYASLTLSEVFFMSHFCPFSYQGAYRDDEGRPVVLGSVREAERRVAGSHFME